jgi:hypothetical protein
MPSEPPIQLFQLLQHQSYKNSLSFQSCTHSITTITLFTLSISEITTFELPPMPSRAMHLFFVMQLFSSIALAHVEMSWPYPLRSKFNTQGPQNLVDYSMTSPLEASGANYPCKGYQANTPLDSVATLSAGQQYNMTLSGSATHNGGSCQISLSYDGGATFRVIKSIIGGCPLIETLNYQIPAFAPSGKALLAWTWQNHSGSLYKSNFPLVSG